MDFYETNFQFNEEMKIIGMEVFEIGDDFWHKMKFKVKALKPQSLSVFLRYFSVLATICILHISSSNISCTKTLMQCQFIHPYLPKLAENLTVVACKQATLILYKTFALFFRVPCET